MDNWRIDRLKTMLEQDPEDDFLLYALAQESTKSGLLEQGLEYYQKLKSKNPDYVGLYYHLAALYIEMERSELVQPTFEEGIAAARRNEDHHALSELMNAKTNFELTGEIQ